MNARVFIVDTNVVAAGLITNRSDSPTARILDAMLTGSLIYLLSADLLNEFRHVLLRPKLARLHGLQEPEVEQIMIELTANALWRDPTADRNHHPPDPFDHHLWDLLASEPAAILITGDQQLMENPRPQSPVISPATWGRQGAKKGLQPLYNASNTVLHRRDAEVDQEPQPFIRQSKIGEDLLEMDRQHVFNRFENQDGRDRLQSQSRRFGYV